MTIACHSKGFMVCCPLSPLGEKRLKVSKPRPALGASVQTDWYGWLPEAKMQAFRVYAAEFEACYSMLSVSLNEALGLRDSGQFRKSSVAMEITPSLCSRLADRLYGMLCSLDEHAKHYGIVPSVAPLDAENFLGLRGQRSAQMNSLLSAILLPQRTQFLSKITSLKHIVGEASFDFREAAQELFSAPAQNRDRLWKSLDQNHNDLNTCLRESIILLKCFLRVLPDDQLPCFQKAVASQTIPRRSVPQTRTIRHRRIAQFAGE
jgi:hypothetical protein